VATLFCCKAKLPTPEDNEEVVHGGLPKPEGGKLCPRVSFIPPIDDELVKPVFDEGGALRS